MHQNYHTEFLTGTIYNWEHLLKDDDYKQIIIDSFNWFVKNKKCTINAFVVMPNHFHCFGKFQMDLKGRMFRVHCLVLQLMNLKDI